MLNNLQFVKKIPGWFVSVVVLFSVVVSLPVLRIAHSQNASIRKFVRLDYAPAVAAESDAEKNLLSGKLIISFDGSVKAELRPEAGIPLVYVDILGAKLDVNPMETPYSNGPVRVARLAQLSLNPPIVRASLFLRDILHPNIVTKNGEIEIAFSEENKVQLTHSDAKNSPPTPFSLMAPEIQTGNAQGSSKYGRDIPFVPVQLEIKNSEIVPLLTELNKQTGMVMHFRDAFDSERIDLSLKASDPIEAMTAIIEKASGTLTIEDGEIWFSRIDNPLLLFSDKDTIEGADLRGLAVGDILRALGQIGKFNIILDKSLDSVKTAMLDTLLHKMTIRRMFEVIMNLNKITARTIDRNTLILLSEVAARAEQGSICRVIQVTNNIAQLKELLGSSMKPDILGRVKIYEDFGNLVLTGDKDAVEIADQTLSFLEGRLSNVRERTKRVYFQPVNTVCAQLVGLVTTAWGKDGNLPQMLIDPRTESIMLTGSPGDVEKALKILNDLDKQPTAQAMIRIRVIESGRTHIQELGLETLRNTVDLADLASLPTKLAVPAVLHALDQDSKVRTLANPLIRCMNKEASSINLTETIPIKSTVTTYIQNPNGTQIPQVSESWSTSNTGITLTITPEIFPNNEVQLIANVTYTDLLKMVENHPWTTNRTLTTKIRIKNNETVIIGGLIKKKRGNTTKPFPILNRIPLLKKLVKPLEYKQDDDSETEMVILITPTIIGTESERKPVQLLPKVEKNAVAPESKLAKKR
ncbi:MAG: type II and III secretion system protein [Candidatus Riflebacteria bacterium]|nr:type II and III secretion system protein [Candidatus Riflebacteria bacterium]